MGNASQGALLGNTFPKEYANDAVRGARLVREGRTTASGAPTHSGVSMEIVWKYARPTILILGSPVYPAMIHAGGAAEQPSCALNAGASSSK